MLIIIQFNIQCSISTNNSRKNNYESINYFKNYCMLFILTYIIWFILDNASWDYCCSLGS